MGLDFGTNLLGPGYIRVKDMGTYSLSLKVSLSQTKKL